MPGGASVLTVNDLTLSFGGLSNVGVSTRSKAQSRR
jgi:hypothetical protein